MKKRLFLIILMIVAFMFGIKAQVPYGLNSNPSARPTVFLDFDGQTIDDIYWRPFNGDSIVFCRASILSNASMIKVFNHVAEDFSPFNLNITTDSAVYFAAPITRRMRVIITPTWSWYGAAGGVAYIESFRWGLNTPCFVFDTLLSQSDKRVAEAASHEIGHTLGLYHQAQYRNVGTDSCTFAFEYHPGRGSGEIAWAPIMGNSYDRNMGLWHIGISSIGCNWPQNDLSIIVSTANGITYKADDHGNNINLGTQINFVNQNYSSMGLINDSNDVDYFRFQLNTPGRFIANVKPFNSGPPNVRHGSLSGVTEFNGNVDLEVTLFRNNTEIRKYNPATQIDVTIDTIIEPGNYSLKINSVSNANIFKSGMIGSYILEGSFGGSVVVPIRDINVAGKIIKEKHRIDWQIITDIEVEKIWIEVSNDGINFRKLKYINGLSGSYEYIPNDTDAYYRIGATSIDGITKYSNVIYITPISITRYKLVSNIVYNNQIIINTKNLYEYKLFDIMGKNILNGRFINGQNVLEIPQIRGLYFLQIIGQNITYIEKIVKL